jgi:perosamine synthetase
MVPTVDQMCVSQNSTVEMVLKAIDKNAQGICFVVNESGVFVGVITDGDIRRCLLKGFGLGSCIAEIVNTDAFILPYDTAAEVIQKHFTAKVKHIPLLDSEMKVVDYACVHRLHRIPVMEPFFGGNELAYVTDCIKSGWISSKGKYVTQFEEEVGNLCKAPFALAVSNGTTALHLALEALGIGPGDEVIVPDFTFAASINSILYTGAIPVIVDIEPETWTLSVSELEKAISPKTKAIMPVHIYGHPCDMDQIMAVASKHKLLVIEDCAEALGSTYRGQAVGSFGDAATFSFFGNKVITTGEGGMVLFKNEENYNLGKVLRDHGMSPQKRYWHDVVGYNYRMTNLQAAVGVAQLEQFDSFLSKRKSMAKAYDEIFVNISGISPQPLKEWATSCHWLYTVLLADNLKIDRDTLIQKLMMNGIETRPTFYPLHEMPIYKPYIGQRRFPNSLRISRRGISLPSSVTIEVGEIQNIATRIRDLVAMAEMAEINEGKNEVKV